MLLSGIMCTIYMGSDLFSAIDFLAVNFLTVVNFMFSTFFLFSSRRTVSVP